MPVNASDVYFLVVNFQKMENTTAQVVNVYYSEEDARSHYHATLASNYTAKDTGALLGFSVALLDKRCHHMESESTGIN